MILHPSLLLTMRRPRSYLTLSICLPYVSLTSLNMPFPYHEHATIPMLTVLFPHGCLTVIMLSPHSYLLYEPTCRLVSSLASL